MKRRAFLGTVAAGAMCGAAAPPLRLGMAGLERRTCRGVPGPLPGLEGRRARRRPSPTATSPGRWSGAAAELDPAKIYPSLEAMLDQAKPQAVVAFTSTAGHPAIMNTCARRKIPVMMEKPLAVGMEQARAIEHRGRGRHPRAGELRDDLVPVQSRGLRPGKAGESPGRDPQGRRPRRPSRAQGDRRAARIPRVAHRPGEERRRGPLRLRLLRHNLMTWLMDNARPVSVTAVTQRIKPEIYARVNDEATIILEYPGAQAIIQASWNWPFDRKDMEVYGRTGQALTVGQGRLRVRLPGKSEDVREAPPLAPPGDDFLRYFAAVVRGEIRPSGLSSLKNNLVVTEILDAARRYPPRPGARCG